MIWKFIAPTCLLLMAGGCFFKSRDVCSLKGHNDERIIVDRKFDGRIFTAFQPSLIHINGCKGYLLMGPGSKPDFEEIHKILLKKRTAATIDGRLDGRVYYLKGADQIVVEIRRVRNVRIVSFDPIVSDFFAKRRNKELINSE